MKKKGLLLILTAMLSLLTGCLFKPVEDLYRLPERFPGDESLMTEISRVRKELESQSSGVEYATILSGDNTTTIQLQDLDGDGERETAVTFFRVPDAEYPIQIYFFTQVDEDIYQVSGAIQSEGIGIYAVDFVDLNNTGKKEIVVSWQTRGVSQLGAYSFDEVAVVPGGSSANNPDIQADQLMYTGYNGYCLADIDQSGLSEIAIVQVDTAGANSYLEIYGWKDGVMQFLDAEPLSSGITVLSKIQTNYLEGFVPAIYISSTLMDGARATDIIAWVDGALDNLTLSVETGVSVETLREYGDVSATDINSDGILEMPRPKSLPIYGEGALSDFWLIQWSQYDVNGEASEVFTTYHNVSDGWYLIIPEEWEDRITISRDDSVSGQRTVMFSLWNGVDVEPTPFLAIYRLTGTNRFTRAELTGRFELGGDSTTIYAASFFEGGWDCGLTEVELIQNFRRIISSWDSN